MKVKKAHKQSDQQNAALLQIHDYCKINET